MTATEGMTDDDDRHSQYQRAVADTAATPIARCVEAVLTEAQIMAGLAQPKRP